MSMVFTRSRASAAFRSCRNVSFRCLPKFRAETVPLRGLSKTDCACQAAKSLASPSFTHHLRALPRSRFCNSVSQDFHFDSARQTCPPLTASLVEGNTIFAGKSSQSFDYHRRRHFHPAPGRQAATFSDEEISSLGLGDRNADIFDRDVKRHQRDRSALLVDQRDPIMTEVTDRLLDRLEDCRRTFPLALVLGGAGEHVRNQLNGRGGVEKLIMMDTSPAMVALSKQRIAEELGKETMSSVSIIGDEEYLPFKENSLDLVISSLGLHWVNDLPGAMTQCRRALKPDGLFLSAMLGGETLRELRIACTVAQEEREGGISPRISPLAQVRDAGNLLTRAGLALPTVDVDEFTVRYPSALELVEHLRAMGESNAVRQRAPVLRRDTALATAAVYQAMFGEEDGTVPATFQVIYMAGWSPHASQQRPKARGSAPVSLKDIQKALGDATNQPTKEGSKPGEEKKAAEKKAADSGRVDLPSGSWYKIE